MKLPATEKEWLAAEAARRALMEKYVSTAPNPHPYAGMSILDILWQDLDDVMDQLMGDEEPRVPKQWGVKPPQDIAKEQRAWGELRGQAQGLAFAIAVLTNPYKGDVPAVKKEAMQRWQTRQDEGE